jgi:hypothetical protein
VQIKPSKIGGWCMMTLQKCAYKHDQGMFISKSSQG